MIVGGCLCRAVRYEADEPPFKVGYCHCRMCQKFSGAPVAVGAFFHEYSFRFTAGRPKFYQSSVNVERGFCECCGSRLLYRPLKSGSVSVEVGSLDDPEMVKPQYHTGIESQICWFTVEDKLPRRQTDE